jgi:integrase/recombinase XerD
LHANAAGIRISDLLQLKWKNFDGTHIQFHYSKNRMKIISVKLPTKALEILNYYKSINQEIKPNHFIFPFFDNDSDYSHPEILFKAISSNTAYINKNLKTH